MAALAVAWLACLGLAAPQTALAADNGPYKVCSDIPWPPFEMTKNGDFFGFDLAAIRSIAAVEGFKVKIQNLSFDSIIPSLRSGKCDIGASGFTITKKRARVVDFSSPYYLSNQAVVIRSNGDTGIIQALTGKGPAGAIGAQTGTTGADWIKHHLVEQGYDVKRKLYETYPLAIRDLVNGHVDAVIQDTPATKASISTYPKKLVVAGVIKTNEYFGFNVKKGDPKDLLARINEGKKKLGLNVKETPAGYDFSIQPDSPWAKLNAAFFGHADKDVTAAWGKCKDGILNADSKQDVAHYAQCMDDAVNNK
jgi:polar amino acid transport system substrate-binding protein